MTGDLYWAHLHSTSRLRPGRACRTSATGRSRSPRRPKRHRARHPVGDRALVIRTNAYDDATGSTYDSNVVRSDSAYHMTGVAWDGAGFGVPANGGGHTAYVPVSAGDTLYAAVSMRVEVRPVHS